jgi:hypothetical protein
LIDRFPGSVGSTGSRRHIVLVSWSRQEPPIGDVGPRSRASRRTGRELVEADYAPLDDRDEADGSAAARLGSRRGYAERVELQGVVCSSVETRA